MTLNPNGISLSESAKRSKIWLIVLFLIVGLSLFASAVWDARGLARAGDENIALECWLAGVAGCLVAVGTIANNYRKGTVPKTMEELEKSRARNSVFGKAMVPIALGLMIVLRGLPRWDIFVQSALGAMVAAFMAAILIKWFVQHRRGTWLLDSTIAKSRDATKVETKR